MICIADFHFIVNWQICNNYFLFKGCFTAETWRKLIKPKTLDFTKKKAAVIMAEYNARMNKSTGSFF